LIKIICFQRGPTDLRTETDAVSETSCFYSLEHRTKEKVQTPSNFVHYFQFQCTRVLEASNQQNINGKDLCVAVSFLLLSIFDPEGGRSSVETSVNFCRTEPLIETSKKLFLPVASLVYSSTLNMENVCFCELSPRYEASHCRRQC
jgi:hypothetical protein